MFKIINYVVRKKKTCPKTFFLYAWVPETYLEL